MWWLHWLWERGVQWKLEQPMLHLRSSGRSASCMAPQNLGKPPQNANDGNNVGGIIEKWATAKCHWQKQEVQSPNSNDVHWVGRMGEGVQFESECCVILAQFASVSFFFFCECWRQSVFNSNITVVFLCNNMLCCRTVFVASILTLSWWQEFVWGLSRRVLLFSNSDFDYCSHAARGHSQLPYGSSSGLPWLSISGQCPPGSSRTTFRGQFQLAMPAGMPTLFQHGATNTPHSSNSIGDWSSNENSTGVWCPAKSCVVQGSESEIHQTSIMVQVATRLWEARWHVAIFFIKMARFVSWRLRDIVCQFLMNKNVFSYVTAIHIQSARLFISCDVFACVELAWVFNNISWMACDANQQWKLLGAPLKLLTEFVWGLTITKSDDDTIH